mmetsp:Transcript_14362/g.26406  ORF Transcript_14362/g.26406 Transcript_14362/m.26406 type:complete len:206 (-) Transcript_14362:83-700(-)
MGRRRKLQQHSVQHKVRRQSLWELLAVPQGSPYAIVKQAYRQRVLELHPDKGGSPELFQEVVQRFKHFEMQCKRRFPTRNAETGQVQQQATAPATAAAKAEPRFRITGKQKCCKGPTRLMLLDLGQRAQGSAQPAQDVTGTSAIGSRVEIVSRRHPELHGRRARLVRFNGEKRKWVCSLECEGTLLDVKLKALRLASSSPEDPPP